MADAAPAAPAAAVATPPASTSQTPPPEKPADSTNVAKPAEGPRFKVKVDGKEQEVSQDELIKGYQLESAARKRTQEATEAKKLAERVVAAARAGDTAALREAGLTEDEIEQFSIKVLSAKHKSMLEEERRRGLEPKDRETEDKLRELEDLKAEKQKASDAQRAESVGRAKQALSKAVIDTMQEFPESVRQNEALAHNVFEAWAYCIQHPDEAKELGIDPSPKGIAKAIRKRQLEIAAAMVASADDEELPGVVSESIAAKILAKRKAAAEAAAHPSLTSTPQVRGAGAKPGAASTRKRGALVREITLGSLGLKG